MTRKLILPVLTLALLAGIATASLNQVQAQEAVGDLHPMLSRLITKFGLNEAEVIAFVEQERAGMQEARREMILAKLDEAVANGTITAEQKELLLQKFEEMHADGTPPSKEQRAEFRAWATEMGIDLSVLMPGPRGEMRKGPHGFEALE